MAANQRKSAMPGVDDRTPTRTYVDYEVPEELYPESGTLDFGQLRTITMKLLTPLEEKTAVSRARGDNLRMAYELAESALHSVTDDAGQEHRVQSHDGTLNMLFAQMHPKIRALVMQAYSEDAVPSGKQTSGFLKSRKIRV